MGENLTDYLSKFQDLCFLLNIPDYKRTAFEEELLEDARRSPRSLTDYLDHCLYQAKHERTFLYWEKYMK